MVAEKGKVCLSFGLGQQSALVPEPKSGQLDFLACDGEMGEIMLHHDWSGSTLGPVETWPQPLRIAVRLMLNTRHPMYIFWGPDGACLYNDAYRASIGPERHPRSLGRPAREVWDEIWDIIGPQIEQVMAGRPATWHENQLVPITRHGRREEVYWTYSYGPIDDPAATNGIGGVLVVCTETTATVLAQKSLAEQTERQNRLFQQAPSFMAMLEGPEHRFTFINPAYRRVVGNRDVLGRTLAEALPEAVEQGYLDLLDQVFRSGEATVRSGAKFVVASADGASTAERYVDFVYQPIVGPDGAVTGVFVDGYDATERTLAEQALRASELRLHEVNATLERRVAERAADLQAREARLRTIFETSYQLMGLLTLDGTLVEANAASLGVIEASLGDVAGKFFWQTPWFTETPGAPEAVEAAVNAAARGDTVREELSLRLPGGVRVFDFSVRPIKDAGGSVIAMVPEALDITERRVAEESLRQAQKLEAMGQLTGGVAHDFNNLLTPIMSSLDMLIRAGTRTDRERRLIMGGMKSAERAKTLVQRLLAFARRQPLQVEAVDVPGLINGMAELLASTLGPRIKVVVDAAPDLPSAKADPNQLEMAILNLSVNARDAMPHGGELTISARTAFVASGHPAKLPPGDYVRVSITDTGAGMDADTARRAIEPFFSTKGVGQGTGLGLSMAHGLAAQLGGGLTLTSEPGVGTKVDLWLPVSAEPRRVQEPGVRMRYPASWGTALLVDDEELVRMSTADMLVELGFTVLEAPSAEEALRMMDAGARFDVLITDHLMPGMTGVDLAYALRERRPGVPALIISGFAEKKGIASDLPRLTKPFRQADLAAILNDLSI